MQGYELLGTLIHFLHNGPIFSVFLLSEEQYDCFNAEYGLFFYLILTLLWPNFLCVFLLSGAQYIGQSGRVQQFFFFCYDAEYGLYATLLDLPCHGPTFSACVCVFLLSEAQYIGQSGIVQQLL